MFHLNGIVLPCDGVHREVVIVLTMLCAEWPAR
jgi:hypothetical protein